MVFGLEVEPVHARGLVKGHNEGREQGDQMTFTKKKLPKM
jgi:hypothetical protein